MNFASGKVEHILLKSYHHVLWNGSIVFFYLQVIGDSFKVHKELQLQMEYGKKPNQSYETVHLHVAHRREMKKELALSESINRQLCCFHESKSVQSLVKIIQQDAVSSHSTVLKVTRQHLLTPFLYRCLASRTQRF